MIKRLIIIFIFVIQSILLTSGCKLSVMSVTGPSTSLVGQIITIYIKGESLGVAGEEVTLYGLILQIPDHWEVVSARATIMTNYDLIENPEYESLYTPELGHKIWVGTATESQQVTGSGTVTVLVSVGNTTGQYRVKAAAGSYRNGVWTTDDPAGKFNFSDITGTNYFDTITVSTTASTGRWEQQKPITQAESINGIWGTSDTNVFAVGYDGTILHYDGTSWSSMTSCTSNILKSIWGSSATDVFAVGYIGTIMHYDGTSWRPMTSNTFSSINDIWGTSDTNVFAVASSGTILNYCPTIFVSSDGNCGTTIPCYSRIQDAIDNATTGAVILVKQGTYPESIRLGSAKTLFVKGGYNSTYDQQTANMTFIQGVGQTTIQAPTGSLKLEMLTIKSPQ